MIEVPEKVLLDLPIPSSIISQPPPVSVPSIQNAVMVVENVAMPSEDDRIEELKKKKKRAKSKKKKEVPPLP